MRFSRRTGWNTEESALARAHRLRAQAGLPIADLTASNPTRCGFDYAPDLLHALTDASAFDYDPQPRGSLRAREAVCGYYADHGALVRPEQVVLTTSSSEAYSYLFRLLCDPGNEILVPQPGYPLFDFLAALDDVRLKPAPLVYDHGWQMDPEGFRRTITPQARAIVVVHPNNPTGHFTKPWEAEALARICREFELSLIVDEVFLDYGFSDAGERFVAGLAGAAVFVVSGLSKIAGLPQMKAAWIAAFGPERERGEALARLEIVADTFLSMNAPVQLAMASWLAGREGIQGQIRERARGNLATLRRVAVESPGRLQVLEVDAGWSAVLGLPGCVGEVDCAERLARERGVIVHPGGFYGMGEAGRVVVSLIGSAEEFAVSIQRATA